MESNPKRSKIDVKDWRTKGEHILLVLQRPGDTSLRNPIAKHGSMKVL